MQALDLLNSHSQDSKLSLSARVAYLPDFAGTSAIGVLWAYNAMAVESGQTAVQLQATDVRQDLYGVFVNWAEGPWQLRSALYDVNLRLQGSPGGAHAESFVAGYVQIERQLQHGVSAYAREEKSSNANHSAYLQVVNPEFQLRRATLGVLWDFWRQQALTFEGAYGQSVYENQTTYRLKWSAAFP